jgi:hypothetical protein
VQAVDNAFNGGAFADGGTFTVGSAAPAVIAAVSDPPVIPPEGGRLDYRVTLFNPTDQTRTFQAWVAATMPDGTPYGVIEAPRSVTLAPGQTLGPVVRSRRVPGSAPNGTYTVTLNVGRYPNTVALSSSFTFEKGLVAEAAAALAVEGAAPNPFPDRTTIWFSVGGRTDVRLTVFDALGREVAVLLDEAVEAGAHGVVFDGARLASGVYTWRLEAGGRVETGRLTLIR